MHMQITGNKEYGKYTLQLLIKICQSVLELNVKKKPVWRTAS